VKFKTTGAHGNAFKQVWLGAWRKYTKYPQLSAARRNPKGGVDDVLKALLSDIDELCLLRLTRAPPLACVSVTGRLRKLSWTMPASRKPRRSTKAGSTRIPTGQGHLRFGWAVLAPC
jgi:hypothetical protein